MIFEVHPDGPEKDCGPTDEEIRAMAGEAEPPQALYKCSHPHCHKLCGGDRIWFHDDLNGAAGWYCWSCMCEYVGALACTSEMTLSAIQGRQIAETRAGLLSIAERLLSQVADKDTVAREMAVLQTI